MRYFSQNGITRAAFNLINHSINTNKPNITLHYPNDRIYRITPVLVINVTGNTFHCHFMADPYYRLNLDNLNGSLFTAVYEENGQFDREASVRGVKQYNARCYEYILHDIYMPDALETGDILLCGRVYPKRTGGADPVLV